MDFPLEIIPGERGGGDSLYEIYRYVRPKGGMVIEWFWSAKRLRFWPFWSKSGYFFTLT